MEKIANAAVVPVVIAAAFFFFLSPQHPPLTEVRQLARQQVHQQAECVLQIPFNKLRDAALSLLLSDERTIDKLNKEYAELKTDVENRLELDIAKLNDAKGDVLEALDEAEEIVKDLEQKRSSIMSMADDELRKMQQKLDRVFDLMQTVSDNLKLAEEQLEECHKLSIKIKQELILNQLEIRQAKPSTYIKGVLGVLAPAAAAYLMPPIAAVKAAAAVISTLAGYKTAKNVWDYSDLEGLFDELLRSLNQRSILLEKARQKLRQLKKRREKILKEAEQMRK